jgi:hypothetical protein
MSAGVRVGKKKTNSQKELFFLLCRHLDGGTHQSLSFRRKTKKTQAIDPRANPADEPAALSLKRPPISRVGVAVGFQVGVADGVGFQVGVGDGVGVKALG